MATLKSTLTQLFPPKPSFTEKDLPDLSDKVYIVTGANAGVGKELTRQLYSKNAKVYMLTRSEAKTNQAIEDIKKQLKSSTGSLVFLHLDLADMTTIRGTVDKFLALETRLDVLFNNAGVMSPEKKLSTTPQGYELHVGVNVLGVFLLTKLLTPVLATTVKIAPPNTVRVIWAASSATEMFAQRDVGATPEMMSTSLLATKSGNERYWYSKVANWAHGAEYAVRYRSEGIISVPLNPGNLQSDLYREQGVGMKVAVKLMMYPAVYGACTELYAGLSGDVTLEGSDCWVIPFGRIYPIRKDLSNAVKSEAEGGTGGTSKFWEWTEEQVRGYY